MMTFARPEIPAWNQRSGTGYLDRLRRVGVDPASAEVVFCTHLHIDHVGWNTVRADGSWAPTFPHARYLVGRTELADWLARKDAGTAPAMNVRGLQDSVLPLVEAGRVDLVDEAFARFFLSSRNRCSSLRGWSSAIPTRE